MTITKPPGPGPVSDNASKFAPVTAARSSFAATEAGNGKIVIGSLDDPTVFVEAQFNPKELEMVEECPGDDCGYLFRDTSHGRRRWCSMRSCGNRAKVQRFRDRQREEAVA